MTVPKRTMKTKRGHLEIQKGPLAFSGDGKGPVPGRPKEQPKNRERCMNLTGSAELRASAWSGSFRASRCLKTAVEIDDAVNQLISNFIAFYQENSKGRATTDRRRVLGVHVLADDVRRRLGDKLLPAHPVSSRRQRPPGGRPPSVRIEKEDP
jgi:hypothetical protein